MTKHLMNWVNHCKKWASDHNCKYSEALKNADCRSSYKKGGESSESPVESKPKRKYTRKMKMDEPKDVPLEVMNIITKRKYTRKAKIPSSVEV